jgi:hypothetical protein
MTMFPGPIRLAGPLAALRSPLLSGLRLGQSAFEWYRRAKDALAKYEALVARLAEVANRTARLEIETWLGSPLIPGTPAYRYATVRSDVLENVEAYTPPNYGAYQLERRQNRVVELEDHVKDFSAKVTDAERVYGRLPPPTVIERERRVEVPGEAPDIAVPLVVAGAAVALAIILVAKT